MKPRHQVSRAAIDLIKRFEGYRRSAAQLPDGRWTIGYGHTLTARQGAEVSEKDAEALLLYDLIAVAHAVNEHVFTPLTQNQFDALVCFAFNIGEENFRRSSVLRRINEGAMIQAACLMEMWRRADFEGERIVIDALVRRRAAEKALFLTPPGGVWTPAPSSVLRPQLDHEVALFAPQETPTAVRTSLEGATVTAERDEPLGAAPHDPGPTAAEIAAAKVGARLAAMFQDAPSIKAEPLVAVEPVEEAALVQEPALQSVFDPEPAEAAEGAISPDADDAHETDIMRERSPTFDAAAEPQPEPGLFAEPSAQSTPVLAPERHGEDDEDIGLFAGFGLGAGGRGKTPSNWLAMALLALLGVAIFGASVVWNLNAAPSAAGDPPLGQIIGWALGLAGVGCVGAAAYSFLRRLGGED